jgi:hypothetical protein
MAWRTSLPRHCVRYSRVLPMAVLVALAALDMLGGRPHCATADDPSPAQSKPAQKTKPTITVSKRTTYILEPRDAEGFVDYLAALNQMSSRGVTPANNAGVLLVRAFGGPDLGPADRARFFRLLGVQPPEGPTLVDFVAFAQRKLKRPPTKQELADFQRSMNEPWSIGASPLLAEWLQANEKPLGLVVEATRRTQCYWPLVAPAGSGLVGMLLPGLEGSQAAARLLTARAMSEIAAGKIADAERDLLACHRLARLCGRAPFMIQALMAYAGDSLAYAGDARLMDAAHFSAESALAYQRELRGLAPLPTLEDVIEQERFQFLDTVSTLARTGGCAANPNLAAIGNLKLRGPSLNWDDALSYGNDQYDRLIAAARKPSLPERKGAFQQIDREMAALSAKRRNASGLSAIFSVMQNNMGREFGEALTVLLAPAFQAAFDSENRARTREVLEQVGFALAAYRADHGGYPDSLSVLAPKYIDRLPNDPMSEQPLHYRREGTGCLLYSVGTNGVDEGGRTFDSKPPGDDLLIRLSAEPRSQK